MPELKGPQQGGAGKTFVTIDAKKCEIVIKDSRFGSIDGIFQGLYWEKREANKEHRMPAHIKYSMKFIGIPEPGGQETELTLEFNDHWKSPGWSSILNALAGAVEDPNWDQYFNLRVWGTETGAVIDGEPAKRLLCSMRGSDGGFLPNKFPFDQEKKALTGVPQPKEAGKNEFGDAVLDWSEVKEFWLKVAEGIQAKFTGAVAPTAAAEPQNGGGDTKSPNVDAAIRWVEESIHKIPPGSGFIPEVQNGVINKIVGKFDSKTEQAQIRAKIIEVSKKVSGLELVITKEWVLREDDDLPF